MIDLDECIERISKGELLDSNVIRILCDKVKEILIEESNVLHISSPVTVVGDVHGQFYDVLEIWKIGGSLPSTNYLFLGDFVDRGHHSVETMSLLMCLKLRYPKRMTLIRGNHESRQISLTYGFYEECRRKYGNVDVWTYFTDMFDYLTISVVIDGHYFCVHGGLSPSVQTLDQIRVINRFQEIPNDGPFADLIWSDPDGDKEDFGSSPRNVGYVFGRATVTRFLELNQVSHILRAHQLCMEGYQELFDNKLSTVWSAPNYSYKCGNKAAILEISESLEKKWNFFDASELSRPLDNKELEGRPLPEYFL